LAAHPQLLLADEPTAALDGATGREVVELLRQLARDQSCAVLMVTHDPRILDVADRLLRMEDGCLLPSVE
jgi:putative ABC transport system ATP-binding protein